MEKQTEASPWPCGDAAPRLDVPAGAVDCHHHIFDSRFHREGQTNVPDATAQQFQQYMQRLGLSRSIVVAPSNYGTDNACLIDALQQLGTDKARGVAYVDPDVTGDELEAMHRAGVRGIRVYLGKNRVPSADELRSLGACARDLGWSLQFVGGRQREVLVEWATLLLDMPCPIVIDHFGWTPQPAGTASETAKLLMRLLDHGNAYVKLSGPYLSSERGLPDYDDLDALGRALVGKAPSRIIWGSDWPHPMAPQRPDSARLFDKLEDWAPDGAVREMILVSNPAELYWRD